MYAADGPDLTRQSSFAAAWNDMKGDVVKTDKKLLEDVWDTPRCQADGTVAVVW